MNRSGTLWVHAGPHKTGTTSIQSALQDRAEALRAAGLLVYPEKNAWRLANLFIRPDLRTTPRVQGWAPPPADAAAVTAGLGKLRALRAAGPDCDVIVSSEEFCLLRTAAEAAALRDNLGAPFARVVTVVAQRDPAEWRRSRRDQLRKTGNWQVQKALPDAHSTDGAWYYDPAAITAFWARIGPVRVLDYDAALAADGSILPSFARAIGHPGLFDGLDLWLNARQRRSLPQDQGGTAS